MVKHAERFSKCSKLGKSKEFHLLLWTTKMIGSGRHLNLCPEVRCWSGMKWRICSLAEFMRIHSLLDLSTLQEKLYMCVGSKVTGARGCGFGHKQSNTPFPNPCMKSSGQCPMATALGTLPNFPLPMFSIKQSSPDCGVDEGDAEVGH